MASVAQKAIPTTTVGFGGTPVTFGGAGIWTLVVLAVLAFIKGWPALKKIGNESDASLRRDLLDRINSLEQSQAEERAECTRRLRDMQTQIDGLTRQLIAFQVSSGRPLGFTPEAVAAADRVLDVIAKKGEE